MLRLLTWGLQEHVAEIPLVYADRVRQNDFPAEGTRTEAVSSCQRDYALHGRALRLTLNLYTYLTPLY